jgi:hypothetical protein
MSVLLHSMVLFGALTIPDSPNEDWIQCGTPEEW